MLTLIQTRESGHDSFQIKQSIHTFRISMLSQISDTQNVDPRGAILLPSAARQKH